MLVLQNIPALKAQIKHYKTQEHARIGLVPTMGALHQGHLSLMKQSKAEQDRTLVSIFVNPLQFGPNEDFEKYPRPLTEDLKLCEEAGVDLVFTALKEEMYPKSYRTHVEVEHLTRFLCGQSRPVHFRGVTTVVSKLFHLVQPDRAYFGKKDAQQCLVLQKMVDDLHFDLTLSFCETVREPDGLALSSRNRYLTSEQRSQAPILKKTLNLAQERILQGQRQATPLKEELSHFITAQAPLGKLDYLEIVDREQLQPIEILEGKVLLALAVFFGPTRLIDNFWMDL